MIHPKTLFFLVGAFLLYSCSGKTTSKPEKQAQEQPAADWVLLAEGNNLEHWEMYNQGEIKGWELINGELHGSGAGWDANQDLITKQAYDNFELSLEWKIAPANSSGIFFYVPKGSDQPIYDLAPEYQILDDKGWPKKMQPNQYTGGSYAMYAPEGAEVKPVGEWNTTRILVNYPYVEHWLNGKKVVAYEIGSKDWQARKAADKWAQVPQYGVAKSGHIGLQNAGKVTYRHIKIKEL
ncbi:3-keto-disaccharide hydrolase [Adhaeribacter pallidiroseus]|uniref:3-keto-alpha-glucoside-1,2-lyase/3-keto-2-hydroxy-glucal hydratase domain-containing protein n=1 Tax=Adhaeribacter pallidiroseus TaxID=2072847 RepID=A0A369Q796_9BACT|nr:DUF1080 domain-containing protein [Adhaeribacter pallidiroseus]RDC58799.1 hypothetical protein AHMF7616_05233 [Adhaeribacter pallidiroseus]